MIADVREDGVSAPNQDLPGLLQVVDEAEQDGVDLKIVFVPNNPPIAAPLRDIATDVGKAFPGSTVIVMSPSFAGSYSTQYDRVTLEAGEDLAKTGNPVVGSQRFLDELSKPHFPWTAWTIVLVIFVIIAVAVTRLLQVRARRATQADEPADSI